MIHFISNTPGSLFSSKEFGFIQGRSTVLQLLHIIMMINTAKGL